MSLQPLKLLFYVVAAAFEVTLLHLGVSLISFASGSLPGINWLVLLLLALVSAFTLARFEPPGEVEWRLISPATLIVCVIAIAYAIKVQAGGGWNPLGGWSAVWPFGARTGIDPSRLFMLLLVSLWAWWRGNTVLEHDHSSVLALLQRGTLGLIVLALLVSPLSEVNLGAPPWGPLLVAGATVLIGFGLLTLALARITDDEQSRPANGWRWLRSSVATAFGIIVVGTLLLALVSNTATLAIRSGIAGLAVLLAVILSPIAEGFLRFWLWITAGRSLTLPQPQPSPSGYPPPEQAPAQFTDFEMRVFQIMLSVLNVLLYLLPLMVFVILIIVIQRRRRRLVTSDGAVHESLWSWNALGADLLGLIKGVHLPQRSHGLRDALARLRGDDPAQRIRRRYVQLLLLGEAAERERKPQDTPLEHESALNPLAPAAEVHTLTDAYDRARYAPDTVQPADADRADAAWTAIDDAEANKENR